MLFNSIAFIFGFLPLSLLGYYMLARWRWQAATVWLGCASLAFYAWWDVRFLILLVGSILFNYTASRAIARFEERPRLANATLAGAIVANLALLFVFKYLVSLLALLGTHWAAFKPDFTLVLPLGISFFTFTQIGFLVDCRQQMSVEKNFFRYVLFVTFFPHLIAGPILHHREMMPQFSDQSRTRFDMQNLAIGLTIFIFGLAKKTLIADHFAGLATPAFADPSTLKLLGAWKAAISYSLQLYFDFSGYSDMAIGLARMFGIVFPLNFNSPFKARSIIDFWQRFHMTLTRYLTLYLYNPMALSITRARMASGKTVGKKAYKTFRGFFSMIATPTIITMGLAGVWHGAGLQFFLYGFIHGLYITINHAWRIWGPKADRALLHPCYVLLTYLCVVISWIFFRSESTAKALTFLGRMFGKHGIGPLDHTGLLWIILALAVCWTMPNVEQMLADRTPALETLEPSRWAILRWKPNMQWAIALGLLAAASLTTILAGHESEFLYFKF